MTGLLPAPKWMPQEALIAAVIGSTGELTWVEQEAHLDAVTALSGSGPAYVFLFLEAMTQAGVDMGLTAEQSCWPWPRLQAARSWRHVPRRAPKSCASA